MGDNRSKSKKNHEDNVQQPEQLEAYIELVKEQLLPEFGVVSEDPHDPVVVRHLPKPWKLLGAGNYAAVAMHPDYPDWVVKRYAPGRPGLTEEAEVYTRLGRHPAFSECLHYGDHYLILRRLTGVTLYDCILRGIYIPRQVIDDIDRALDYAVSKGLHPHDVHGKNVMLKDGRGIVVDVSDFLKPEPCSMWDDLKKAYDRFYFPVFHNLPVPGSVMNLVRKGYRYLRKFRD
jgi:hypothetical protein